jgi:OmpA-OmpF porin, OOP family
MKRIAIAALLSAFAAAPALAADQGAFVNVDLGQVSYSGAYSGLSNAVTFANPGSIRIGGGYNFTPNIAVEAGYSIIGDSTITTSLGTTTASETLKASSLQVAAVGTFPINDMFNVFGKLGLASSKLEYSCFVTSGAVTVTCPTFSGSKTNLMFGLGGKFNINKNWGIRVQYEDFGKVDLPAGSIAAGATPVSITAFSIGGVYSF